MTTPLRVLIVEDSEDDAQLVLRELRRGDYDPQWTRVESPDGLTSALARQAWDVIICDYSLPHFDAPAALKLVQGAGSDIPFIIVSGKIGEDTAVAAMKAGAHDYVMKDRLERLPAAVAREMRDATMCRERKRAEQQVQQRVMELGAFYRLSEVDERQGLTLEELYQETTNTLPQSWQYPEVTCARMVIDDREFRTANFAESPWMQVAEVRVNDSVVGRLEVGYLVEKPAEDEGSFLREEREVIQDIAKRLGGIIARRRGEHAERVRSRWAEALLQLLQLPPSTETEVIAFAVESLVALTGSKLCFVGLVDGSETTMSGHVWSQQAMQECALVGAKPVQFDVAQGGLWTAPIRQRQTIVVNDYAAPNPLKKGCPAGHVPLARFLGVPLLREGRAVLVAGLANKVEDYGALDQNETVVFLEAVWGVLNRNRAQEALRLKNSVFDASLAANSIADVNGVIVEANGAFLRMWGYAVNDEVVGKPVAHYFDDPNEAVAAFEALSGADHWEGDFSAKRRDGSDFVAHGLATTLRDAQGSVVGYQAAVLDITERKQAEMRLAHLYHQHELVLDSAAEGILGLDLQGKHTFVNPAAATILGYEAEELVGRPSHGLWHHTRADGSTYPMEQCEILATLREGRVTHTHTDLFWRKDGTSFPVEFAATPIVEEGVAVGAVVTFADITERMRVEQESSILARFERLLTDLSASLAGASAEKLDDAIVDILGRVCEFLDADIGSVYKTSSGATRGLRMAHLYSRVKLPPLPDAVIASDDLSWCEQRLLAGESVVVSSMERDVPAEAARDLETWQKHGIKSTISFPLTPGDGHVVGTLSVDWFHEHILEKGILARLQILATVLGHSLSRRQLEETLREQTTLVFEAERLLRLGSWSLDVATQMFQTSSVMDDLFGISKTHDHSVAGWAALLYPDDRAMMLDYLLNEVISGKQPLDKEFRIVRQSDHAVRWLHALGELEIDADGHPMRLGGTSQDITERKWAEAEREKLEEQLRASQRMEAIGSLAGGVAHDFNNLLQVILSYTDFAMERVRDGDPLKGELSQVKKAGESAAALTRQLLAFSRKQVRQPEVLSLNKCVAGVEKMLRRVLGEDIDLTQVLAPDLGMTLADPGQIEQVLMNLVVNSRDAMPEGGKLTIETSNLQVDEEYTAGHVAVKPGWYVQLVVSDTGCGMDEQTRARIFEPFFTTKEKGRGTGLGLSTVYGIVEQSGGYILVCSELAQGTTVKIHLPRELSVTKATGIHRPKVSRLSSGTETILVVDDEEALRNISVRALGVAGFKVLTAADGHEALLKSAQHAGDIHLLLTDVVMPRMSGKVLAQELAKTQPAVRVIYMSGYTDDAIVHHGVLDPAAHFLAKPFTSAALRRKVREVLDEGISSLADWYEQVPKDVAEVKEEQPLGKDALRGTSRGASG